MLTLSKKIALVAAIFTCWSATGNAQIINTVAGSGDYGFMTGSYGGDGGQATAALMNNPSGVVYDAAGNLYVTDSRNARIRKITPSGIITTIAGTGTVGYSGDGGAATAAEFSFPESITMDASGNIYVIDRYAPCVRKISTAGVVTTIAGNGTFGFAGDGGPATAALLDNPMNVTVDAAGNVYICDWINARVRKINTSGIITTIAGNGSPAWSGDGGPATAAGMRPTSLLITTAGEILVCDGSNNRLRKIDASGIITTIAGTGVGGYSGDGGPATAATLRNPAFLLYDPAGNLLVCDENNQVIRKIDPSGTITTIAGTGTRGFSGDGGPATAATLQFPMMMTFSPAGQLLFADNQNNRVRKIDLVPSAVNNAQASKKISVYPNPATDLLIVDNVAANSTYRLVDITGHTVMQGVFGKSNNTLSLHALSSGVYFLQVANCGVVQVVKD